MNSARCAITRSGWQHVKCSSAVKGVTQRSVDQGRHAVQAANAIN